MHTKAHPNLPKGKKPISIFPKGRSSKFEDKVMGRKK
jgi:hypothetical protein